MSAPASQKGPFTAPGIAQRVREAISAIVHVGPSVAYVGYVFYGGSVNESGDPLPVSDKVLHAAAFGVLVPLVLLAVTYLRRASPFVTRVVLSATIASAIGALLELWQLFFPWRSCDVFDWLADTVGAVIVTSALLGGHLFFRRMAPSRA